MSTSSPQIWVDADACPVAIREMLVKAGKNRKVNVTFVANHPIPIPRIPNLKFIQVQSGFDIADNFIVQQVADGDLVVTQDIPLADEVITKGAIALGPRGQKYTKENIKSRLNMRDFLETMRSSGVQTGGPPPLNAQDKQTFGNALDQWIAKNNRNTQ